MSEFPVEHNIPMPPRNDFKRRYSFRKLHVRDSFLVPCEPCEIDATWNSLTSCKRWATRQTGFTFEMRRVLDGIRVWRTK